MNRRVFLGVGLSVLAGFAQSLEAQGRRGGDDDDKGRHNEKGRRDEKGSRGKGPERRDDHGGHHFRREDADHLRQHYRAPSNLPPGLRKQYYRNGKLPPGWEKRIRPFPKVVIQRLPPPPPHCDRGYIDGFAVVYDRRTRIIVDVLDLMDAALHR